MKVGNVIHRLYVWSGDAWFPVASFWDANLRGIIEAGFTALCVGDEECRPQEYRMISERMEDDPFIPGEEEIDYDGDLEYDDEA